MSNRKSEIAIVVSECKQKTEISKQQKWNHYFMAIFFNDDIYETRYIYYWIEANEHMWTLSKK